MKPEDGRQLSIHSQKVTIQVKEITVVQGLFRGLVKTLKQIRVPGGVLSFWLGVSLEHRKGCKPQVAWGSTL